MNTKTRNGTHGTTGARRKTRRAALLAAAGALLAAASALAARETPLHNARLGTDLNAGGHAVTNLAPPTASSDAATRGYVDEKVADVALSAGNAWHAAEAANNRLTAHEGRADNPHGVTVRPETMNAIYRQMTTLNKTARDIMLRFDVHSCTDHR